MKKITTAVFTALLVLALSVFPVLAAPTPCDSTSSTVVPGHCDRDGSVVGHYTSIYAYDAVDWYWDLGDGRVYGTVGSLSDLDPATLTSCTYEVNYRGDFGNDPYMDNGWIMNQINCSGYDDNGHYSYLIVHQTDPRYDGDPDLAIWGTWEYHVLGESGKGNLARPDHPVGN